MALDLTKPNASAPAVPAQQKTGLAAIIKSKIANTLSGKKGEQFVADVVALVRNNPALATCDQVSLVASCLQAQTLGLSLNGAMGQAWVVPFEDRTPRVGSHSAFISVPTKNSCSGSTGTLLFFFDRV